MTNRNQPAEPAQWFEIDSTFATRYFAEKAAVPLLPGASGASVYEKKLRRSPPDAKYMLVPHMIYFYYMRINTDAKLEVDHYTYEPGGPIHPYESGGHNPANNIRAQVQHIVDCVRGEITDAAVIKDAVNNSFENIEWKRISYIVFFFDEEHWSLHKEANGSEGVRFVSNVGGAYANHTFYDADDFLVRVRNDNTGRVTQRSAIAFINHMKRNANGDELGSLTQPESQRFKFEMIFDVRYARTSRVGMTVIFDPDGTNTGPPIGPPP